MKLNQLKPGAGSRQARHRVGRFGRPFAQAFAGAHAELAVGDEILEELVFLKLMNGFGFLEYDLEFPVGGSNDTLHQIPAGPKTDGSVDGFDFNIWLRGGATPYSSSDISQRSDSPAPKFSQASRSNGP